MPPPDLDIGDSLKIAIVPALIGLVVYYYFRDLWFIYGALFALAAFGAWMFVSSIKRKPAHLLEVEKWRKTWICKRCGEKFIPQ